MVSAAASRTIAPTMVSNFRERLPRKPAKSNPAKAIVNGAGFVPLFLAVFVPPGFWRGLPPVGDAAQFTSLALVSKVSVVDSGVVPTICNVA